MSPRAVSPIDTSTPAGRIGAVLRAARLRKKWTIERAAEECGVSQPFLGQLEHGQRSLTLERAAELCCVLGIKPAALLAAANR